MKYIASLTLHRQLQTLLSTSYPFHEPPHSRIVHHTRTSNILWDSILPTKRSNRCHRTTRQSIPMSFYLVFIRGSSVCVLFVLLWRRSPFCVVVVFCEARGPQAHNHFKRSFKYIIGTLHLSKWLSLWGGKHFSWLLQSRDVPGKRLFCDLCFHTSPSQQHTRCVGLKQQFTHTSLQGFKTSFFLFYVFYFIFLLCNNLDCPWII